MKDEPLPFGEALGDATTAFLGLSRWPGDALSDPVAGLSWPQLVEVVLSGGEDKGTRAG